MRIHCSNCGVLRKVEPKNLEKYGRTIETYLCRDCYLHSDENTKRKKQDFTLLNKLIQAGERRTFEKELAKTREVGP
jgi:uncharacterized protein YlaI